MGRELCHTRVSDTMAEDARRTTVEGYTHNLLRGGVDRFPPGGMWDARWCDANRCTQFPAVPLKHRNTTPQLPVHLKAKYLPPSLSCVCDEFDVVFLLNRREEGFEPCDLFNARRFLSFSFLFFSLGLWCGFTPVFRHCPPPLSLMRMRICMSRCSLVSKRRRFSSPLSFILLLFSLFIFKEIESVFLGKNESEIDTEKI